MKVFWHSFLGSFVSFIVLIVICGILAILLSRSYENFDTEYSKLSYCETGFDILSSIAFHKNNKVESDKFKKVSDDYTHKMNLLVSQNSSMWSKFYILSDIDQMKFDSQIKAVDFFLDDMEMPISKYYEHLQESCINK